MNETIKLFEELEQAKKAVISCLENEATSVNFHGIAYWAGEVERLRKAIKEKL